MATAPRGNVGEWTLGPGDRLMAVFRACSRDPTQEITRLRHMLDQFLQHPWDESAKEVAAQCCRDATSWYWTILEKLLNQESKKPGSRASNILGFDLIQRLLVACSLEIAITTNGLPCDIPELLQILKLSSYDFLKAVMLVFRAAENVPRAGVRHLVRMEEKVLESLVWTRDSPLWEEIRANEGRLPSCLQVLCPSQLEDPATIDQKPNSDPPPTGGTSDANPSTSSDLHSSQSAGNRTKSIHPFARRVYTLMAGRLRELCSALDICDELRLKIWTCFEHSLVHCTFLMADRHLDQLLMCAVYITAKITQREIPFKSIMKCYNSQQRTNRSVCKNSLITGGVTEDFTTVKKEQSSAFLTPNTPSTHYPETRQQERGNIIHFYNKVYVTTLEPFAKQFAPSFKGDTPPLSPFPRQRKASVCKQRLSSHHSIFISRLNTEIQSLGKPAISYVFNSSPRDRLREINNMVRLGRPPDSPSRAPSAGTQGEEEEGEEGEDGPSAKRIRLDDQSAWHRRLRGVVNDRVAKRNQV
ncbi:retinoblastoma-like protein 2 isoform X2 [Salarias fasciatus]|uniref:retinoblastoma-like protein 2 isoform X2 n=1 Tax=Salarias fasciatus TaxID=181472 RepID=UPI001176FC29|nr:retinoblastoma-like protein 2 isoform X2 [Salarias fasciatus]